MDNGMNMDKPIPRPARGGPTVGGPTFEQLENGIIRRLDKPPERGVYVLLMFGPAHATTLQITEQQYLSRQAIVIPDRATPMFKRFSDDSREPWRVSHHLYRFDDEYESSNMEECAIYVHDEGCCDAKMPDPAELDRRGAIW